MAEHLSPTVQPGGSPPANSQHPSALVVNEADGQCDRPNDPGNLYFYRRPGVLGDVPGDQERAHQEFERFSSILRTVFQQEDQVLFRAFFERLLSTAKAAFDASGFHSEALGDLAYFKQEIVQKAGARIKARDTQRLIKAVVTATVCILLACAILQITLNFGLSLTPDGSSWTLLCWNPHVSIFHTGLLLAASMWGLLFASVTRSIEPTFETLLTPDADLMPPWVRLVFYGLAVLALALVFELQIVTFHIGESFSTAHISTDGATALLVGFLLGVLERALPQEVERWSKEMLPSASRRPAASSSSS